MKPKPIIGQVVLFIVSAAFASGVSEAIARSEGKLTGNVPKEGEVLPMTITAVHSADCVNGRVHVDGNFDLWVTSVLFTTSTASKQAPGSWFLPVPPPPCTPPPNMTAVLLKEAANRIDNLRRANEVLQAQVNVVNVFAAALNAEPSTRGTAMEVDFAWELRRHAIDLEPENA